MYIYSNLHYVIMEKKILNNLKKRKKQVYRDKISFYRSLMIIFFPRH